MAYQDCSMCGGWAVLVMTTRQGTVTKSVDISKAHSSDMIECPYCDGIGTAYAQKFSEGHPLDTRAL